MSRRLPPELADNVYMVKSEEQCLKLYEHLRKFHNYKFFSDRKPASYPAVMFLSKNWQMPEYYNVTFVLDQVLKNHL